MTVRDSGCEHAFAERHAAQSASGRVLARLALSACCPVRPQDWRFSRDGRGKPFIVAPLEYRDIHFSISHTDGLVACLISVHALAAVDVERIRPADDLSFLAPQLLSASEQRSLAALNGEAWLNRFFEYWTLKEAYTKAIGLGLGSDLSSVSFDVGEGDRVIAHFSAAADGDPETWAFRRLALGMDWAGAVAIRTGSYRNCGLAHVEISPQLLARESS